MFIQNLFPEQLRAFFQPPHGSYHCKPMDASKAGGNIVLPPSALQLFFRDDMTYYVFRVENEITNKRTHCTVEDFVAEEGVAILPRWMMQTLGFSNINGHHNIVRISPVQLPKGSYVKIQPHTQSFFSIANPRVVLEVQLRKFMALTRGDTIMITYNSKDYYFNILEVTAENNDGRPPQQVEAISIAGADLQVEFETALDYVESAKPVSAPNLSQPIAQNNLSNNNINIGNNNTNNNNNNNSNSDLLKKEEEPVEVQGFKPFTGSGYSLRDSNKAPSYNNSNKVSSTSNPSLSNSGSQPSLGTSPPSSGLVLSSKDNSSKSSLTSSNNNNSTDTNRRVRKREPESPAPKKDSNPSFVPFTGKGNSLK